LSTPPGLDAAHFAFERGDFAEARRLARVLQGSAPDAASREAAETLLRRTSLDPVIVWVTIGCVLFYALVVLSTFR
jgi:hypothetical protein